MPTSRVTGPGLYLHFPFCRSKCGYCAFNSVTAESGVLSRYLNHLEEEIIRYSRLDWCKEQRFTSLFMGGGTPSLASAKSLAHIIKLCRSHFTITNDAEISLEANPDSLNAHLLEGLHAAGVNRLSIGVQSFQNDLLTTLQRPHSASQAIKAFELARACGFTNINIDLIYGLPGQTLRHWQEDLKQALSLGSEHLALYELSIEPGTAFSQMQGDGRLSLPHEDLVADMEAETARQLTAVYEHYEISNHARPGYQCQHNLNYWLNGSYLGLGAGAFSCLDGLRVSHQPDPNRFMAKLEAGESTISQAECLSRNGRFRESVIMGLRLCSGFNLAALERRLDLRCEEVYGPEFQDLLHTGMLIKQGNILRIAPEFLPLANQILTKLV